jgi:hypothetical protein
MKDVHVADFWSELYNWTFLGSHNSVTVNNLDLQPGLAYRFKIKFCANKICFQTIYSNGVTVIPNKPVTGSLSVDLQSDKVMF